MRRLLLLPLVALGPAVVAAGLPANEAELGRAVYTNCVACHGERGQGGFAPPLVGSATLREDQAAIGFRGAAPEADGVVRSLDVTRPIFDKARAYYDVSSSYNLRFANNKLRARVQLNVRNVFERGRLQAVAVNPDGQPYAYRIIDPRQFILTTTFDL